MQYNKHSYTSHPLFFLPFIFAFINYSCSIYLHTIQHKMPPITFGFSGSPKKEQGLIQYTTDLPSLTPSSSWSSILSSLWSVDTSNDALPETHQSLCNSPKIENTDRIMMGPPRCRKKGRDGPVGVARYNPVTYRCSGYVQKGYEWFSGLAEAKDQRFLIDLKHGSMDR